MNQSNIVMKNYLIKEEKLIELLKFMINAKVSDSFAEIIFKILK